MATNLTLKIGGIDLLPFVADGGIEWNRNDVDSSNAGEMQDGTVRRDRKIMRRKMTITMNSLTTAEMKIVQQAIYPQWVTVEFLDPPRRGGHNPDILQQQCRLHSSAAAHQTRRNQRSNLAGL